MQVLIGYYIRLINQYIRLIYLRSLKDIISSQLPILNYIQGIIKDFYNQRKLLLIKIILQDIRLRRLLIIAFNMLKGIEKRLQNFIFDRRDIIYRTITRSGRIIQIATRNYQTTIEHLIVQRLLQSLADQTYITYYSIISII